MVILQLDLEEQGEDEYDLREFDIKDIQNDELRYTRIIKIGKRGTDPYKSIKNKVKSFLLLNRWIIQYKFG